MGCQQVAAALEYLHGRGIVHNDVREANILQTPGGRSWKLVDFDNAARYFKDDGTRNVLQSCL